MQNIDTCLRSQNLFRWFRELIVRSTRIALAMAIYICTAFSQYSSGTLQGRVADERGDVIVGVTLTVVDARGVERTAVTNGQGIYVISKLATGKFRVRAEAPGFALYEKTEVNISPGRRELLDIRLRVFIKEELEVQSETGFNTDPDNDGSQIVLSGSLLDALPDDPAELADALKAFATTAYGPNGVQTLVDGFTGGRLPPKDLIREIRINRNPFSAEYDRPGFSRVEVFTKPGTEKFHGQAFMNYSHNSLNSRNPFAAYRSTFQSRLYGASLSGSINAMKLSYSLNYEGRVIADDVVVNAALLDTALNIVPFRQVVRTPQHYTYFSPRFDYLSSANSLLSGRYSYTHSSFEKVGLTTFSLPSSAPDMSSTEQALDLTYVVAFSATSFNDSRFQYARSGRHYAGDGSLPTINVLEAFTGGGAQVGSSSNNEDRWEIVNNASWAKGNHTFRAGGRLRGVQITDVSPSNFNGTYTFAGGLAPSLDASNQIVRDANGRLVLAPITSIERYRRTLLFQQQGLAPATIRHLGGGAAQFSIAVGDPKANVSQLDLGLFMLDEWRVRPNMIFSYGLRYETQSNMNTRLDFGPRLAFIWNPGAGSKGRSKTLIRVGFGVFYDRISETLALQARRFNGFVQRQFIAAESTAAGKYILDSFPHVPPVATLAALTETETIRRLEATLHSPYTILSGVSIERQLPLKITLTTNYANRRRVHDLRSRNINAPLLNGTHPFGDVGKIFEFETGAIFKQHQLTIQARYATSKFNLFTSYTWSRAESNSDGPFTFPANSHNLSMEYGRTSQDIRHSFSFIGNLSGPWDISLSPFITVRSGFPFNITTGNDTNNDGVFMERPAFATDLNKPGVKETRFGHLDLNPAPGQRIIPRNFGSGPGFFQVNLRLSKSFSFGASAGAAKVAKLQVGDQAAPASISSGGEKKGYSNSSGSTREERRHKLTLSIQALNLTNRTNFGPVIGNLSSPMFGQSNSIYGGSGLGTSSNPSYSRRIEAQIRYNF